ncbi:hypothetical protein [Candidatus Laterigemmans baculatus]|uniref:hypothetical protein n=1 Tax=Candidatus Laterigemmans baculatus TaxID=2770505 RepID=UPI0013DCE666|nr:hypothetical protein [Candidatus Laterigemmans baculatus]
MSTVITIERGKIPAEVGDGASAASLRLARPMLQWTLAGLLLAFGQLAAIGQPLEADPPLTDDQLRSRVSELVDTLDADQLAQRQQAERDLLALGPEALRLLPEPDDRFSAEAQQRLRRVRLALQQQRAEADAGARTVRLGSVTTLQEALAKITAESGIEFEVQGEAAAPLQLTLGPLSFWETLDVVLDAAELDVNFYAGGPGRMVLVPRGESRPSRTDSAAYAGVYRLEATATTARRDFHQPQLNRLTVGLEVAWEPRLTPIGLNLPLDRVTAVLGDGTELKPDEGQFDIAASSQLPFSQLNLPLPLPAGSPQRIATLRGTLRAMLPGAAEHFEVPLANPPAPAKVGNLTFAVEEVRPNGEIHEVRMEVAFEEAGNAFESHRQWIFENPAYVTDAEGNRLEHLGYQVYRQTSNRVGIGYLFDLGGELEGKTFHYHTPISVVAREAEFELKDIPLP